VTAVLAAEAMGGTAVAWSLVAGVLLLGANAVFVAYEFALLATRQSAMESLAAEGDRRSRAAVDAMSELSVQLAGAQLGITMASLGLGYVAEPALAALLDPLFGVALAPEVTRIVGFVVALGFVVFLHLVLGEMVPKNIAISSPDATLLWLVLPYRAYLVLFRPLIRVLDALANAGCRLLGVRPRAGLQAIHSPEEIAAIVSQSHRQGVLPEDEAELLSGALHFARVPASEVLVPLADVVVVRRGATVAQVERVVAGTGHSRIPVVAASGGRYLGYVHAKDLLAVPADRWASPLPAELIRPMPLVRDDRALVDVLRLMRRSRVHLAVVLSGADPVGIVSLEDVIEALVGDIAEEGRAGEAAGER
jgi:CBS domain containing-hemolysin-like protein